LAWLDTEQGGLTAAVELAADTQRYRIAVGLASCLAEFLAWRRQLTDWVAVAQVAAHGATHLNDPSKQADALEYLGLALWEVRRFDEAITAHTQAGDIYRELGDRHGEGRTWNNFGLALQAVRRFDEAWRAWEQAVRAFEDSGDLESAETMPPWVDGLSSAGERE
jgi:tetratricopeptide (TPR) repeat protein